MGRHTSPRGIEPSSRSAVEGGRKNRGAGETGSSRASIRSMTDVIPSVVASRGHVGGTTGPGDSGLRRGGGPRRGPDESKEARGGHGQEEVASMRTKRLLVALPLLGLVATGCANVM